MIDRLPVVQQVGRVLSRPEEAPRSIRRRRDEMWNMMGNGEEDGGDQSSAIQTDKQDSEGRGLWRGDEMDERGKVMRVGGLGTSGVTC